MINDFLIINCIGKDDKLGLRINKDFFIYDFQEKKMNNEKLVEEMLKFTSAHNAKFDENFTVIVNQGPGSFSGIRVSLAVAKGLEISKKVKLFGYLNTNLKVFDEENITKLIDNNLIEKNLIKPIYLS